MKRKKGSGPLCIPTGADWENHESDLDQKWAHDQFCGWSNEEMQNYFRNNPIESTDDLRFMPEVPFRYYMIGYRDFVLAGNFNPLDASDAANCYLSLALEKLENQSRYIVLIMPELLASLKYVSENQARFEAAKEIYGDFSEKFARIQDLYASCKDRYRGFP